jgi:hypothetical protein
MYTIEELKNPEYCVFLSTKEQWDILRDTNKAEMTSSWYGPCHYFLGKGSWIAKPRQSNKVVQFNEINFPTKQLIMEPLEILGYVLTKPEYKSAALSIANIKDLDPDTKGCAFRNHSEVKDKLLKAGVLDLWFEPVYKEPIYKVGDWVLLKGGNTGNGLTEDGIYRLMDINSKMQPTGNIESRAHFMFRHKKNVYFCTDKAYIIRMATYDEIAKRAVEIAKKDGIVVGANLMGIMPSDHELSGVVSEFFIDNYPGRRPGNYVLFLKFKNDSRSHCVYNYYDILQWEPNIPRVTINGHIGEFFEDKVKFGCAIIDKQDFIDLNNLATKSSITTKKLKSVTFGAGVFSREVIKEIAEYYQKPKL